MSQPAVITTYSINYLRENWTLGHYYPQSPPFLGPKYLEVQLRGYEGDGCGGSPQALTLYYPRRWQCA